MKLEVATWLMEAEAKEERKDKKVIQLAERLLAFGRVARYFTKCGLVYSYPGMPEVQAFACYAEDDVDAYVGKENIYFQNIGEGGDVRLDFSDPAGFPIIKGFVAKDIQLLNKMILVLDNLEQNYLTNVSGLLQESETVVDPDIEVSGEVLSDCENVHIATGVLSKLDGNDIASTNKAINKPGKIVKINRRGLDAEAINTER